MKVTYRYRVKDKHIPALKRMARSVNFVWNYANDTQRHALKWGKRWPTRFDLNNLTAGSCKELGLMAGTVNAVCERYAQSRGRKQNVRYRGQKSLGWVPVRGVDLKVKGGNFRFFKENWSVWLSRGIAEGTRICNGSNFSEDAQGRWYLNVVLDLPDMKACGTGAIGIDLGLKDLAALSNGEIIAAPQHYRKAEKRLGKAHRAKKKGQVIKINAKIANQRKDFLHKVSTCIVRDFDKIIVGDVNAEKLKRTRMAKSVSDAGWSILRNQLRYKAIAHGAEYVEVSEKFTTQTCSDCGSVSGPKGIADLGIREWDCPCGSVHDRDINSAKNILRLGHQALAEGAAL